MDLALNNKGWYAIKANKTNQTYCILFDENKNSILSTVLEISIITKGNSFFILF